MKTTASCLLFGSRKQFFITTLVAALLLTAVPAMSDTFTITMTAATSYSSPGDGYSSCTDTVVGGLSGVSVECHTRLDYSLVSYPSWPDGTATSWAGASPVGGVTAAGHGDAYSGSLCIGCDGEGPDAGTPQGHVTLSLEGIYYLTGTGPGSLDFGTVDKLFSALWASDDVTLLFNGVSYHWSDLGIGVCQNWNGYTSVDAGGCPLIDDLQFGVAYPMSLSIDFTGTESGSLSYDLTAGLSPGEEITAVPEPASAVLLLTGIPVALFRRARKRTFTRSGF
jgi:hypothetical protein